LIAVLLVLAFVSSCRTRDIRVIQIYVPEMKNKACEDVILKALSTTPTVDPAKVQFDRVHRTVTVEYDSLSLSVKNIEFNIADAGFAANSVPANQEARKKLPPECLTDEKPTLFVPASK